MSIEFSEIMVFGIPESYYEVLQLWAAERNFRSSGQNFTAEKIAAEIICEFIDEVEQMEIALSTNDDQAERKEKSEQQHNIEDLVKKDDVTERINFSAIK